LQKEHRLGPRKAEKAPNPPVGCPLLGAFSTASEGLNTA